MTIDTTTISYRELKARHEAELNGFEGMFFAFNNSQFAEGMGKLGLDASKPEDQKKISRGPAGCFFLRERVAPFLAMLSRHDAERKAAQKARKHLLEALKYELNNHEYCITGDPTGALETLGLTLEDVPADIMKAAIRASR